MAAAVHPAAVAVVAVVAGGEPDVVSCQARALSGNRVSTYWRVFVRVNSFTMLSLFLSVTLFIDYDAAERERPAASTAARYSAQFFS